MNTRAFTLALVIAVAAMFMVYTYIEDKQSEMIKKFGQEKSVVVAKVDIQELELIDDSKVTVISVPENFISPGRFEKIEEVQNTIATVPILKGEQITKPRLTFPGSQTGLARQVSVGKRAYAISVDSTQSVSRLVKPGDRVDIICPIDISGGQKDMQKVKTVLQDVLVLSTGLNMTNSIPLIGVETPTVIRKMKLNTFSSYNTITLELDPFQVQKLSFLMFYAPGRPVLTLRNNNDKKIMDMGPTNIYEILGEGAAEARQFFAEKYKQK